VLAGTIDDIDGRSLVLDLAAPRPLVGAMLDGPAGHPHGGFLDHPLDQLLVGRFVGVMDSAAGSVAFRHSGDAGTFYFVLAMFGVGMGHLVSLS
jgi:hypothetical protein